MVAAHLRTGEVPRGRAFVRWARSPYASRGTIATTHDTGHVSVEVSLDDISAAISALRQAPVTSPEADGGTAGQSKGALDRGDVRRALRDAAKDLLLKAFGDEFEKVVGAYRTMLRESLALSNDPELQAALNQARLQERILANTAMVDQAQACALLGLSGTNPSATMKRKEDRQEILRFTVDGRAAYPLFQFDVDNRRSFPAMTQLIQTKPRNWSGFRLLHWLTRPHLDFDGTPAQALGGQPDEVLAAFRREMKPEVHG